MLNLFKNLKFLEAVAFVLAGVISIVKPDWAIEGAAILAVFVAVLKLFGITPELQFRSFSVMDLPPIIFVLKFWEFLAFAIAGIIAVLKPEWALDAGTLLAFFLAVLRLLGINPKFMAR